jgi:hypothetical protein
VKQVLQRVDGWEDVTVGDKKPNIYTYTKNAEPQFSLMQDAESMDYFILFFSYELLNNIVIETDSYARHKTAELHLSPLSIWSRWSDVSVPEVKSFLGPIINMSLTLSGRVSKYIRHCCPTSFGRMANYVRTCLFCGSPYFDHTALVGRVCSTNVFVNVFSTSSCHLETIV